MDEQELTEAQRTSDGRGEGASSRVSAVVCTGIHARPASATPTDRRLRCRMLSERGTTRKTLIVQEVPDDGALFRRVGGSEDLKKR